MAGRNANSFKIDLAKLDERMRWLGNLRIEDYIRSDRLGEDLDFSALRQTLERMKSHAREFLLLGLDDFPHTYLETCARQLDNFRHNIENLSGFQAGQTAKERDGLENPVIASAHDFFATALPVLVEMRSSATGTDEATKIMQSRLAETEKLLQDMRKNDVEAELLLKTQKDVATGTGFAGYAIEFRREARQHVYLAGFWLFVSALLITYAATYLLSNLGHTPWLGKWFGFDAREASGVVTEETGASESILPPVETTADAIHSTAMKLAFLSVLYFAMVFTGRAFRASMHNYTVNRHRFKALNTFELFVKGSEGNQETKNAVLLQATGAIFAPQKTGYLSGDKGDAGTTVNLLDMFHKGSNPDA